ncbi:unnamed protein product [Albugo candida]|uniref:Uncharacterized protein n=1 Tax=Albugo candida TaxID=65357 RepID=A0A024GU83_9STRA|nr:unnamed protein product [Albugo candida]|eukprot:CCI50156.1 unnamed protein product [Albugo candida]
MSVEIPATFYSNVRFYAGKIDQERTPSDQTWPYRNHQFIDCGPLSVSFHSDVNRRGCLLLPRDVSNTKRAEKKTYLLLPYSQMKHIARIKSIGSVHFEVTSRKSHLLARQTCQRSCASIWRRRTKTTSFTCRTQNDLTGCVLFRKILSGQYLWRKMARTLQQAPFFNHAFPAMSDRRKCSCFIDIFPPK